jgi:hypothetical protein
MTPLWMGNEEKIYSDTYIIVPWTVDFEVFEIKKPENSA